MRIDFSKDEAKLLRRISGWYAITRLDFFSEFCQKTYKNMRGDTPTKEDVVEQQKHLDSANAFAAKIRTIVKL